MRNTRVEYLTGWLVGITPSTAGISESERILKLLEMIETSIAVKAVHVYAGHVKLEGHGAGVIDFCYRDHSQLLIQWRPMSSTLRYSGQESMRKLAQGECWLSQRAQNGQGLL